MPQKDSEDYLARKRHFSRQLTVYGRKTVLEALSEPEVAAVKLHLATSNKNAEIIDQIIALAEASDIEIAHHDRIQLSRISKNAKQDQGVALDLIPRGFQELNDTTFANCDAGHEFIALDKITNPQNLGMIIRSVCASKIKAVIIPRKGCAKLDALVIKASAGTLFRTQIIRCDSLNHALNKAKENGFDIAGLDANAETRLSCLPSEKKYVFVLGNETEGISKDTQDLCTLQVKIPMENQVESLNVAVTAGLIALRHQI